MIVIDIVKIVAQSPSAKKIVVYTISAALGEIAKIKGRQIMHARELKNRQNAMVEKKPVVSKLVDTVKRLSKRKPTEEVVIEEITVTK